MKSQNSQEHFPLIERLHTDVLEDKYGPISAKVIRHDEEIREVHLIDQEGISRTYAITFFTHDHNPNLEIENINEDIKSGVPIGKAFRKHSYNIRKNVIDVYSLKLPTWLKEAFHTNSDFAKARLSEFYAKQENNNPIIYGTVVEIYSPDFRGPVVNSEDIHQINPSTEAFELSHISQSQIWERLGDKNNWNDISAQYQSAKEKSLQLVNHLKQKVENFINNK